MPSAIVYIVGCSDGSYDVGITRGPLDDRVAQHNGRQLRRYTARRRPVILVLAEEFARHRSQFC
ncbi:MAG TPA: GIY-YIG nuclease family protein [Stellaceae bacterium]|nr:GIY-YIG nuclease family protein [Stellaceae bacterium]